MKIAPTWMAAVAGGLATVFSLAGDAQAQVKQVTPKQFCEGFFKVSASDKEAALNYQLNNQIGAPGLQTKQLVELTMPGGRIAKVTVDFNQAYRVCVPEAGKSKIVPKLIGQVYTKVNDDLTQQNFKANEGRAAELKAKAINYNGNAQLTADAACHVGDFKPQKVPFCTSTQSALGHGIADEQMYKIPRALADLAKTINAFEPK